MKRRDEMRKEEWLNDQINIFRVGKDEKKEVASRQSSPERRRDKIKGN